MKITDRLNDLLEAFEAKSDLVQLTMDRIDKAMERLADESREKIQAISDVVGTKQDELNKKAMSWEQRLDSLRDRLNDYDRWKTSRLSADFESVKVSLTELVRFRVDTEKELVRINAGKSDKKVTA